MDRLRSKALRVEPEVSRDPTKEADQPKDYRDMWFSLKARIAEFLDGAKSGAMVDKTWEDVVRHQGVHYACMAILNNMKDLEAPIHEPD